MPEARDPIVCEELFDERNSYLLLLLGLISLSERRHGPLTRLPAAEPKLPGARRSPPRMLR